jgi:hypothetical protein
MISCENCGYRRRIGFCDGADGCMCRNMDLWEPWGSKERFRRMDLEAEIAKLRAKLEPLERELRALPEEPEAPVKR